ncbi:MAG: hypothetical protein ACP5NV_04255 [Candidatus Woesearchaeota archaeon]
MEVKLENIDYQTVSLNTPYNSTDNRRGNLMLTDIMAFFEDTKVFSETPELITTQFGLHSKYKIERHSIKNGLLIITKTMIDKPKFPNSITALHVIVGYSNDDVCAVLQDRFKELVTNYDLDNNIKYSVNHIKS